jgi:hypothetical protein
MRNLLSVLLLSSHTIGCAPTQKIALCDISSEPFRYILDFDSRISQQKMAILKNNFAITSFGVVLLDGVGNSLNNPYQQDTFTEMPSGIKRITIANKSNDLIYLDVITDQALDYNYGCSVYNIQLPSHKSIKLLVAIGATYELRYGWDSLSKNNTYPFIPFAERKFRIERAGVNPIKIY